MFNEREQREFGDGHAEQRAGEQGGRDGVMRPQAWEQGERRAPALIWTDGLQDKRLVLSHRVCENFITAALENMHL